MNLSALAIALLAFQMFSNTQKPKEKHSPDLTSFLSDDTKGILDCFGKLSSKQSGKDDKLGAILQMISNPVFSEITQVLFNNKASNREQSQEAEQEQQSEHRQETAQDNATQQPFTNDEGYTFETPSEKSREFFRPIENIADAEVKNKLYTFFDNWYLK